MNLLQKLWQHGRELLPTSGFHVDRPIVLLQSDDWGRVGLRDQEGLELLRAAGLALGERAYDSYTLETAEDLAALSLLLQRHHDSSGHPASLEMNFVPLNLDFGKMRADAFREIHLLPLSEGLPCGWKRPGLLEAYRAGVNDGVFEPALHGSTHFCRSAVERHLKSSEEHAELLQTLWQAGTPYIHWRMPWVGYEYWDPEQPEDARFLSAEMQRELIGQTVGAFAKLFSKLPRSACAPGYRANRDTHRAWAQHGIRVAQNGPGALIPPHMDHYEVLHLFRTVELEPAFDPNFSVAASLRQAEACFERGIPAIVSVHSINFHSTVKDFRRGTLRCLDEFFSAIESRHPDVLYLNDQELHELITSGSCTRSTGEVRVKVTRRRFIQRRVARRDA